MLLAVRISSYGCTWEVWRALKKLELLSAAPRASLTHSLCSTNFPRASITRYRHASMNKFLIKAYFSYRFRKISCFFPDTVKCWLKVKEHGKFFLCNKSKMLQFSRIKKMCFV